MATQIQCPSCGQVYELSTEQVPQYAGQTITCTRCQKPFTVPASIGGGAQAAPDAANPPGPATMSEQPKPPGAGTGPASQPPAYPPAAAQYTIPAQQQQSNGLAIASIIFGVIGLFCPLIGGIIAIILGILGIKKTNDPRVGGKGLAIAGISLGAASLVLSTCMVSILLPSLNRARETANRVKCAANMRQIGQAILLYANENRGQYPPDLATALRTQDITAEVFVCPSSNDSPAPGADNVTQAASLNSKTPGHLSYIYIGQNLTHDVEADRVVLYEPFTNHDNDGTNLLFGDGHVEWQTRPMAQKLIDEAKAAPQRARPAETEE